MQPFLEMFEKNREWAASMLAADPGYFEALSVRQEPHFLFIGGHDARLPSQAITATAPGEVLLHRNIANQVHPSDFNTLSVVEYAVEELDVKHIAVVGHYGCGGIKASRRPMGHGVLDHWLHVVRELAVQHAAELAALPDEQARQDRLVELNAAKQVFQLARTPIVQRAWARGKRPILHALVYDVHDGLLRPLVTGVCDQQTLTAAQQQTIESHISEIRHESAMAVV